uniref:Uncharacterized protein n=1 Tax=Anguilla anguilla TaxID=7936 RepID=A0A0E9WLT1_ANGAN
MFPLFKYYYYWRRLAVRTSTRAHLLV